ncbi:MAG: hypothetical protein LBE53_18595 [Paucimonas sp.]|nr:hypothetical protein [Paucimonas sp.]
MIESVFAPYLHRWQLSVDGEAFTSLSGSLLPVRQGELSAMLKVSDAAEEQAGSSLMAWWQGEGAAPVLALEGEALLMLRAQGVESLVDMAVNGRDLEATEILCEVVTRLHQPRGRPLPALVPLNLWFQALWEAAQRHGGLFVDCAATAHALLAGPREQVALHGDIHHANVLDFADKGWLAIDPKGLYGERGFDYANLFCNPEARLALAPEVFARRLEVVLRVSGIERRRMLQWVLAWAGLSAAWMLEDEQSPEVRLGVAQLAMAALQHG